MRATLIAVLMLSCAGDEARRAPAPRTPTAVAAELPAPAAPDAPVVTRTPGPLAAEPAVAAAPEAPVGARAADPREATRRGAHDALVEHCGKCHEGHRPTAKPAALAIFDLDRADWPARFDDRRFESALKRLSGKSAAARDAFIAFRDAERAAAAVR